MPRAVPTRQEADSPTARLARYVAESRFEELPRPVIEAAKACVLDSVACMIGGTRLGPSRLVMDLFREMGGAEEATVPGTALRLPAPHAAYVNAYLANALDFDDTYLRRGHPGSAVVPAALAAAERLGASGRDLLHAVVLGYEVCLRIGGAIVPTPSRFKQVWGLSTWQIFGAAAAVARLLGLDAERTRHAFGLAGLNAPVPNNRKLGLEAPERPLGWLKNNYGWASMGAVLAGLMACRGFVGNRHILDGDRGFWVMAGSDRCDFAAMTAGLGKDYLLPNTGFKPYACCRWTHTALDAARALLARQPVDAARITRVEIHTFGEMVESFQGARPASILDAQYSLPYVLALELMGRSPRGGLSEADLSDPAVLALAGRVTLQLDPEADRRFFERALIPARVVVRLDDGRTAEASAETPTGAPGGPPFTRDDVEAKFRALAGPVIGEERARDLLAVVLRLDEHDATDLGRLAEVASPDSRRRTT